jgi:hypothetical protein
MWRWALALVSVIATALGLLASTVGAGAVDGTVDSGCTQGDGTTGLT